MSDAARTAATERILRVARALQVVNEQLVFIGAAVLPLLADADHRLAAPRRTQDVDAVAATATCVAERRWGNRCARADSVTSRGAMRDVGCPQRVRSSTCRLRAIILEALVRPSMHSPFRPPFCRLAIRHFDISAALGFSS